MLHNRQTPHNHQTLSRSDRTASAAGALSQFLLILPIINAWDTHAMVRRILVDRQPRTPAFKLAMITDYYLCEKCEPDLTDLEQHEHKWWHSLLIIPKNSFGTEVVPKASETIPSAQIPDATSEEKFEEEALASISLNKRISMMEEKLDSTRQTLEDHLASTTATLEGRMKRLDTNMEELKQLLVQVLSKPSEPVVTAATIFSEEN